MRRKAYDRYCWLNISFINIFVFFFVLISFGFHCRLQHWPMFLRETLIRVTIKCRLQRRRRLLRQHHRYPQPPTIIAVRIVRTTRTTWDDRRGAYCTRSPLTIRNSRPTPRSAKCRRSSPYCPSSIRAKYAPRTFAKSKFLFRYKTKQKIRKVQP